VRSSARCAMGLDFSVVLLLAADDGPSTAHRALTCSGHGVLLSAGAITVPQREKDP
jgi:hypothetical protein